MTYLANETYLEPVNTTKVPKTRGDKTFTIHDSKEKTEFT